MSGDGATLGEIIGLARELKGWTLRELEARTGISNAHLSQIENGIIKAPAFQVIITISDALGVSLDRIAAPIRRDNQQAFAKKVLR